MPPMRIDTQSSTWTKGGVGEGNPRGRGPSTDTPARVARSKVATATVAATTAIRIPGRRGLPFSNSIRTSVLAPIASAAMFVFPLRTLSTIPHTWRNGPFAVTEKPKSFGTRAYVHLGRFEGRSGFRAWLTKIAVNEALTRLRKQQRLQPLEEDGGEGETT